MIHGVVLDEWTGGENYAFWKLVFENDPRPIVYDNTVQLEEFFDENGLVKPHIFIGTLVFSNKPIGIGETKKEEVIRIDKCTFIDCTLTLTTKVFEHASAAIWVGPGVHDFFNRPREKCTEKPGFYNTIIDVTNSIGVVSTVDYWF